MNKRIGTGWCLPASLALSLVVVGCGQGDSLVVSPQPEQVSVQSDAGEDESTSLGLFRPTYDFSAATYSVTEGNSPNTSTEVTVFRSGRNQITVGVDVVLTGGSATAGTDFTAGPIRLVFGANETSKTVPIEILGDLDLEPDETIELSFDNFTNFGGAGRAQPTATFTIVNDDGGTTPSPTPSPSPIPPSVNFTKLYDFTSADGGRPFVRPIEASDGNFYGTTQSGRIFRFTPSGSFQVINSNAGVSLAPLVEAVDGSFYGTSLGSPGSGNFVFRVTRTGVLTQIAPLGGSRGSEPRGALAVGLDGNFYGVTRFGGSNGLGTLFRVTPTGSFTKLVDFNGSNGANPTTGLILGSDGNFYGATSGGDTGTGTFFRYTPGGQLVTLASFQQSVIGGDGRPFGDIVEGDDGNFYGVNSSRVYQVTPTGNLTIFPTFLGETTKGLVKGSGGVFYGVSNGGLVYEVTPSGNVTTLFEFSSSSDGVAPSGIVEGLDGNLYGVTDLGGNSNLGTIFRLTLN